jgi:hypothetical protein
MARGRGGRCRNCTHQERWNGAVLDVGVILQDYTSKSVEAIRGHSRALWY